MSYEKHKRKLTICGVTNCDPNPTIQETQQGKSKFQSIFAYSFPLHFSQIQPQLKRKQNLTESKISRDKGDGELGTLAGEAGADPENCLPWRSNWRKQFGRNWSAFEACRGRNPAVVPPLSHPRDDLGDSFLLLLLVAFFLELLVVILNL